MVKLTCFIFKMAFFRVEYNSRLACAFHGSKIPRHVCYTTLTYAQDLDS
eukprot:UN18568